MSLRPLGDKIVVKRIEAPSMTKGGLHLPDTAKEKQRRGKVMAVGQGARLENGARYEMEVKKGDTIVFGAGRGQEVTEGGEELLILAEFDVLAVVD
jgi:chaperonin GroES